MPKIRFVTEKGEDNMDKKKLLILLISLVVVLVLTPLGVIIAQRQVERSKEQKKIENLNATTFASHGEYEIFQKVPLLTGKNVSYDEAEDFGGENYGIDIYDTTLEEYHAYLKVLENNGFKKHVDNGEEGLEGYVYTSHYIKDDILVVVTHFKNMDYTMIAMSENPVLSEHLFYDESYVADNISASSSCSVALITSWPLETSFISISLMSAIVSAKSSCKDLTAFSALFFLRSNSFTDGAASADVANTETKINSVTNVLRNFFIVSPLYVISSPHI